MHVRIVAAGVDSFFWSFLEREGGALRRGGHGNVPTCVSNLVQHPLLRFPRLFFSSTSIALRTEGFFFLFRFTNAREEVRIQKNTF